MLLPLYGALGPLGQKYGGVAESSLLTGLVSAWSLSVDGQDDHGANDLTNNNAVTFVAKGAGAPANMPANVANFVGASSQYFSIADNSSFNFASTGFTLVYWGKSDGGEHQISKDDGGVNRAWVHTGPWYVFQNDATFSVANGLGAGDTNWHLLILWFNTSDNKAHGSRDNGATQDGLAITGMQDQAAAFQIGRFSTNYSNGKYSSALLYSRVLTAGERSTLWNSGAGGFYPWTGLP